MGKGQSKWVAENLSNLTFMSDILEEIQNAADTADGYIGTLTDFIRLISKLVEAAQAVVTTVGDAQAAVINAAIALLERFRDELIEELERVMAYGVYVLPQYEGIDFERYIREELLSPGFVSKDEQDRIVRTPRPEGDGTYFRRVRRRSNVRPNYENLIRDIIQSFDDALDEFRPQFDANTKVSGLVIAVAARRVAVFVVVYLMLDLLSKGRMSSLSKMRNLEQQMRIILGRSASLQPLANPESYSAANSAADALKEIYETPDITTGQIYKKLARLARNLGGNGVNDEVDTEFNFERESEGPTELEVDDGEVVFTKANGRNVANFADISVITGGSGVLTANIQTADKDFSFQVGRNQSKFNLFLPVYKCGEWLSDDDFDYGTNTTGTLEHDQPTTITLTWTEATTETTNPETGARSETIVYKIPAFKQPGTIDGYRNNPTWGINPTSRVAKREIARYLGTDNVESFFPVTWMTDAYDATKFGPEVRNVEVIVSCALGSRTNSTIRGTLLVNGQRYKQRSVSIGSGRATFKFGEVDLGEAERANLTLLTEVIETTLSGDGLVYSEPSTTTIRLAGGKLAKPTITSSDKVTRFSTLDFSGGISGLAISAKEAAFGAPRDSLNRHARTVQSTYGKGASGTKETPEEVERIPFTMSGRKAKGAFVYVIISLPNGRRDIFLAEGPLWVSQGRLDNANVEGITYWKAPVSIPFQALDARIQVRAYQTTYAGVQDIIAEVRNLDVADKEEAFLQRMPGGHHSAYDSQTLTISNRVGSGDAPPPNWMTMNFNDIFPLVGPLKQILDEFIELIRSVVPTGPYDAIADYLDVVLRQLEEIISIIENIRDIIRNLNDILQIGDTGFYFLGISEANGVEGFKQRLQKVQPIDELRTANYVTGVVLLVPDQPGTFMMDTIFPTLPSEGQDNVRRPDQLSANELVDAAATDLATVWKDAGDKINLSGGAVAKTYKEIKDYNWKVQDI